MKRLSGYVFDSYDDADGQVLRSLIENPSDLPQIVKTASRLTPAQIESLPDDQFAVILFDGTEKMKKFATVDQGNTLLSAMYLLKQAHLLPPDVVKTAARNLIGAFEYHGMTVPEELAKTAATGTSPVSGKTQTPYARGAKVQKLQYPEILEEPKESHDNPALGHTEGAWDDVKERVNVEGTPGTNFMETPAFSHKEKVKTASEANIQHWDTGRKSQGWDHSALFAQSPSVRQQSWRETPYFDISGWDPSMATSEIRPDPERTLLDGAVSIDGYDQVKTASALFNEDWHKLPPRERHNYCVKLASRMTELHMPIPEDVQRYGSTTYAADVDSFVEARRHYVHEDAHPTLDMLLEKRAHVSPGVFACALEEFDRQNDLNWHWDGKITDPYFSTFGPSMEKLAEANWRYSEGGTRIGEDELEALARNGYARLRDTFGESFASEFRKHPKTVFESLPAPNKLILARLAMDHHSGTFTEYSV